MRTTSDTWKQFIKDDDWTFIASLKVGDTEYTEITTPTITRNAIPSAMTCGSCVSATLSVSVYTDDTFDPTVPIVVLGKIAQAGTEGYNYSEQLEFGTFYIDTQTKTSDGYVELSCYDAMLKANATYMDASSISSGFPKDMADAVDEIAELIGVEVDDRTELLTGDDYLIQFETGVTAQTVLEQIANCNGGNWIITEDNKLRLIKIGTDFSALESGGDYVIASAVLSSLSLFAGESNDTTYGEGYTFKGVSDSAGDNTTGESPYLYINNVEDFTDDMYTNLYNDRLNKVYYPFTATSVVLNPAFETGDDIYIPNDASFDIENLDSDTDIENYSYICSQALSVTLTLNYSFRATISVDSVGDLESEYPYIGKYDDLSSTVSSVSDTVDSVSSDVSDLSDDVDDLTDTVSDLSSTVNSTVTDLTTLNQHFVYIDDTYANGGGAYVTDDTVSSGKVPTDYFSRITTNGYEITWNGESVAEFADEARVGTESGSRVLIEDYGIIGYTSDNVCNMVIGLSPDLVDNGYDDANYYYVRLGLVDTDNIGKHSLAEGYGTEASGSYSHAEGRYTVGSSYSSHAEGYSTEASGNQSHAEGYYTIASGDNQHVSGKYNVEDDDSEYAVIVGGGTSTTTKNIYTLDWSGNAYFAGDLNVGGYKMQFGTGSVDATKNSVSSVLVEFDEAFSSTPYVVATVISSVPYTYLKAYTISDRSTSGFYFRVYRTDSQETAFCWIAIGKA